MDFPAEHPLVWTSGDVVLLRVGQLKKLLAASL
jgi:hypothetical protein